MELRGISKRNKPDHRFKFGGKEFDKTFGLNWGDFHARQHDPVLGRWFVIDPKADEFYVWSPYNYALNNPLRYVDPDGKKPLDWYLDLNGALVHKKGLRGNQESKGLLWVGSEKSGPNFQLMSMTRDRFSNDPEFRSRILSEMDKVRVRASGSVESSYPIYNTIGIGAVAKGGWDLFKFGAKKLFKRKAKQKAAKAAVKGTLKGAKAAKTAKSTLTSTADDLMKQVDDFTTSVDKALISRKISPDQYKQLNEFIQSAQNGIKVTIGEAKDFLRHAPNDIKYLEDIISSGTLSKTQLSAFSRQLTMYKYKARVVTVELEKLTKSSMYQLAEGIAQGLGVK